MRYLSVYRITAYLLLLFCGMHTVGGLLSEQTYGPESDGALASMKAVHFPLMGADCTWYGLYFGFGLLFSVFLLVSAAITWHLGGLRPSERRALAPVAWSLFLGFVLVACLSWRYFFAAPGATATVIAALLGVQAIRDAPTSGSSAPPP